MNQNESISESNRIKYIFFSGLLKNFLGLKKDFKRILFNLQENGGNAVNIHRHYKSLIDRGGYVKACFLL